MSGSVLCAHFRHKILRTFLAHHANHLGTISWTMGPYFAPIFDTRFCAHFWYIMPTIWAPFHGPSGHHPPPFLSLPLPLAPLPVRLLWISLPQSSALLPTTGLALCLNGSMPHLVNRAVLLGPRKETVDSTIQARATDRALQCQLLCVSRRKNKHNAKSLDKKKF